MSVLAIVVPIFALIAVGYVTARTGLLSETAQKGISEFAFNFAMPALLFRSTANVAAGSAGGLQTALAFFGALAFVWISATILTRVVLRRPLIDSATVAMTSCYGNIVMIGIPLAFAVVGDAAMAPMSLLLGLNAPVLWIAGTLHQQVFEESGGRSIGRVASDLGLQLLRNPILIAIATGSIWHLLGLGALPSALDASLRLLGQAGVPCAQVALGASLTGFAIKGQVPTLMVVLALKLVALPAAVYVLAHLMLGLPRAATATALILAGMPPGANAFLFAERTRRVVNSTSGAVALGTLLGALTSTLVIANLTGLLGP